MVEVGAGAEEDTEVEDIVVAVTVVVMSKEDVGEGSMFITHMSSS